MRTATPSRLQFAWFSPTTPSWKQRAVLHYSEEKWGVQQDCVVLVPLLEILATYVISSFVLYCTITQCHNLQLCVFWCFNILTGMFHWVCQSEHNTATVAITETFFSSATNIKMVRQQSFNQSKSAPSPIASAPASHLRPSGVIVKSLFRICQLTFTAKTTHGYATDVTGVCTWVSAMLSTYGRKTSLQTLCIYLATRVPKWKKEWGFCITLFCGHIFSECSGWLQQKRADGLINSQGGRKCNLTER